MNTTKKKITVKKKPVKISEGERRLVNEQIETLRALLTSEIGDTKSEGINLVPVFHSLERALIKEKIFELIEKM